MSSDDKEWAGFVKEAVSNWMKCWEAVEDIAIRSHQRLLNEQIHLPRCFDATVMLAQVSAVGEAMPLLGRSQWGWEHKLRRDSGGEPAKGSQHRGDQSNPHGRRIGNRRFSLA